MDSRRLFRFAFLLVFVCGPRTVAAVTISEIRIDQPGPDHDEYVELRGRPGESLDDLTYVVLGDGPSGSGEIEAVIPLWGHRVPADGHFLVTEASHANVALADVVTLLNFENSDNTTHLLVRGFSGALDDDLDADDDCVLDTRPWTGVVDAIALLLDPYPSVDTECHYGALGDVAGPDGSFAPGLIYRCGSHTFVGGFSVGVDDTPGAKNAGCQTVDALTSWSVLKVRF